MQKSDYSSSHIAGQTALKFVYLIALLLTPVVAASGKIDVTGLGTPSLIVAQTWVNVNSWWLVLTLTLLGAGGKVWYDQLSKRWVWSVAQSLLNKIQADCFSHLQSDSHHHRVTLFKHVRFRWRIGEWRSKLWPWGKGRTPWSGWLVPILRSGHTTQNSATVFLAPDDADQAEGVAGRTWAKSCEMTVEGLSLPKIDDSESMSKYAEKTCVKLIWVQAQVGANKPFATCFRAIPIEVSGEMWGVLLLDSRNPNGIQKNKVNLMQYAYFFGKLLERS